MGKLVELLQRRIWLGPLIGLLIGLGVGLPLGWQTVDWQPGPDDVASVADSYSLNNDAALARARLKGLSRADLTRILTNLIRDSNTRSQLREADRLNQLAQLMGVNISAAAVAPTAQTATPPRGTGSASSAPSALISGLLPFVLLFLLAGLIVAAGLVFFLRVLPNVTNPQPRTARRPAPSAPARPAPTKATPPPLASAVTTKTASPTPGGLGRFVASYTLGNDNYDTSFSLETPHQDFLGECGMGISDTIGEGKPDKVTAFDLWLFDKGDVRTVTQIIMSEHAFSDQAVRAKLAAKGNAVLAEKGKTISLDTQSLHLDAKILDVAYASTPDTPVNSHFQKLTVEILPKSKETVPAQVPAGQ